MLHFALRPLITAEVSSDSLACLEILAFYTGEGSPNDLEVDEEQATNWYIENEVQIDDQDAYKNEPQTAGDEMWEWFSSSLRDRVAERSSELGQHYPFVLESNGSLRLKPPEQISPLALCYVTLQLYRIINNDFVDILGADDNVISNHKKLFMRHFERLFEYIAGYAVSGSEPGVPYLTSHCRSANDLHRVLETMCSRIGGTVRPTGDWGPVQLETNDGRVDCLVYTGGSGNPGNARLVLVGATIQKQAIDAKIMGIQKLNFFGGFFRARPAAFQGVLVRPQDEHSYTTQKCRDENCLLYSYDEVWRGFKGVQVGRKRHGTIRLLDLKARRALLELTGIQMTHLGKSYSSRIPYRGLI